MLKPSSMETKGIFRIPSVGQSSTCFGPKIICASGQNLQWVLETSIFATGELKITLGLSVVDEQTYLNIIQLISVMSEPLSLSADELIVDLSDDHYKSVLKPFEDNIKMIRVQPFFTMASTRQPRNSAVGACKIDIAWGLVESDSAEVLKPICRDFLGKVLICFKLEKETELSYKLVKKSPSAAPVSSAAANSVETKSEGGPARLAGVVESVSPQIRNVMGSGNFLELGE